MKKTHMLIALSVLSVMTGCTSSEQEIEEMLNGLLDRNASVPFVGDLNESQNNDYRSDHNVSDNDSNRTSPVKRKVKYSTVTHSDWGFKDFDTHGKIVKVTALDMNTLQAAIDEASAAGGGTVELSAGTITVSERVLLKNNVKIIGTLDSQGSPVTKMIPTSQYSGMVFRCSGWKNGAIENILFDSYGQDVRPVECWGGGNENIRISNNVFLNIGLPQIQVKNVDPVIRDENRGVINAVNFYMDMNQPRNSHITVENNYFNGVAEHPIDFRLSDYIIVNNNYVVDAMDGVDISSDNHYVEVLNNDFSNTAEGAKLVGNGGKNIYYHNNATYGNPVSSYWEGGQAEPGGGSGMFIQFSVDNLNIYDNYIDGDRMNIKTSSGGLDSANMKNNISSKGKIDDRSPGAISGSKGDSVFGDDTGHPLPYYEVNK